VYRLPLPSQTVRLRISEESVISARKITFAQLIEKNVNRTLILIIVRPIQISNVEIARRDISIMRITILISFMDSLTNRSLIS